MLQKKILINLISYGSLFVLGVLFSSFFKVDILKHDQHQTKEKRESGYKFINPLLECEYMTNQGNTSLKEIRNEVEKILDRVPDQKISVYYRDLLGGPWYGYMENAQFAPQSLFKLLAVIAAMKQAEVRPDFLKQKILLDENYEETLSQENNLV